MRGTKPTPRPQLHARRTIRPPDGMNDAAANEWRRIVAQLARLRIITDLDIAALSIYCNSYALYREAQRHLDEDGAVCIGTTGTPVKNPWLLVQRDCWDRMKTILGELGLTPSARARMRIGSDEREEEEPELDI